jgi:hypothetical protein
VKGERTRFEEKADVIRDNRRNLLGFPWLILGDRFGFFLQRAVPFELGFEHWNPPFRANAICSPKEARSDLFGGDSP